MLAAQDQVDAGEAARQIDDAHRQLLGDSSIQFELPTAPTDPATGQPLAQQAPGYGPADPSRVPPHGHPVPADPSPVPGSDLQLPHGGGGIEGLMQVFLWIAAGVALVILLYWLFAFIRDRGLNERRPKAKKEKRGATPEVWRPEEELAVQLLDEADQLANAGRFDEAARLLLHRSIREIDAHRPDLVRPALTSRDIARHPLLPGGPAAAFARIAALVERSLFACRPLALEDWHNCRAAYHDFAFADGWQG
jgi:hypothetical protein